jgi:hypothetical protein
VASVLLEGVVPIVTENKKVTLLLKKYYTDRYGEPKSDSASQKVSGRNAQPGTVG